MQHDDAPVFVLWSWPPKAIPPGWYGLGPAGFRGLVLSEEFERWIHWVFGGSKSGNIINGTTFSIIRAADGYAFHELNN